MNIPCTQILVSKYYSLLKNSKQENKTNTGLLREMAVFMGGAGKI